MPFDNNFFNFNFKTKELQFAMIVFQTTLTNFQQLQHPCDLLKKSASCFFRILMTIAIVNVTTLGFYSLFMLISTVFIAPIVVARFI